MDSSTSNEAAVALPEAREIFKTGSFDVIPNMPTSWGVPLADKKAVFCCGVWTQIRTALTSCLFCMFISVAVTVLGIFAFVIELHREGSSPVHVVEVGSEHLYQGNFKIQAFSDIHGRLPEEEHRPRFWKIPKAQPRFSNFEDFAASRLAEEIQKGSATVLAFLGDMALIPGASEGYGKLDGRELPKGKYHCGPCVPAIEREIEAFANWMGRLSSKQYPVKIVIPGNHDSCLDPNRASASTVQRLETLFRTNGIHYLGGGEHRVDGLSVVARSGAEEHRLHIVGMGISQSRNLGCMSAFQYPPVRKPEPSTLVQWYNFREAECGDECSQEQYDAETYKVLDALRKMSNRLPSVDVLLMHGPPDNAGAVYQSAPSGPLVELVKNINPSLFVVGHVHGDFRRAALGAPYTFEGIRLYNVAAKNKLPDVREAAPMFEAAPPTWHLPGDGHDELLLI
jgi:hypothetical protein